MFSTSVSCMTRLAIAVLLINQCASFSINKYHMKSTFRLMVDPKVDSKYDVNPNNEEREVFGGSNYFNGMITDPIAPVTATKVDGKDRDNLTPNIKFVAMWGGGILALFGAFIYANKDITPPPF